MAEKRRSWKYSGRIAVLAAVAASSIAWPAQAQPGDIQRVLEECRAVADPQIAEAVGADAVTQGFYGAICRWSGSGSSGEVRVTFNWFESGSLEVERNALKQLNYIARDATVDGRRVIEQRRPNDNDSCGVTATALDRGIIGWWVQYPGGAGGLDPCAGARTLMKLTLNLSV